MFLLSFLNQLDFINITLILFRIGFRGFSTIDNMAKLLFIPMHIKQFSNAYSYFQRADLDIQAAVTCSNLRIETLEQDLDF